MPTSVLGKVIVIVGSMARVQSDGATGRMGWKGPSVGTSEYSCDT